MNKPLDILLNLNCIKAYCGYAGHLILSFSKYKDETSLKENNQKEAEWEFETISASWRLTNESLLKTGSYEDYEHNDTNFLKIVGKKLIQIEYHNLTDLSLVFEDNFQIDIFNQGISDPVLEIYSLLETENRNHKILSTFGNWTENINEEFTKLEIISNKHSDECEERWKKIVPKRTEYNNCRDCAYFLQNAGRFYFYDFGLCSNGKSTNDGKVVGVKSSCENFSEELNLEK
jgi:hypothetical protein